MAREKKEFNPEAWTPTDAENIDHEVIRGGKEGTETPMEDRRLEHHLLTCPEKELQLFKEYLVTYQKTDALFDSMRKAKGEEKTNLKQEWNNAKERLADARIVLSKELRNVLEALPGFGRKETMRGLQFLATDVIGRRSGQLQEAVTRQAVADKTRIRKIRQAIRTEGGTAQRRTHAIPHVEDDLKPSTPRAGWLKRNARRVALALLPFMGGGAVGTTVSRRNEEVAKPAGVASTMREEELPPMPLKSRIEFNEEEGEEIVSKKPARVVTKEKIRSAVARNNARARHEAALRSTGTVMSMTPEEEAEFATPLAERLKRPIETFEPLDTSGGVARSGGRARGLAESLEQTDPTGVGTHVGLSLEEIKEAARQARNEDESAPRASLE